MLKPKLRRADLWWLFAYPIYQIVGTIRHEGSHAVVGMLEGGRVVSFSFLPTFRIRSWVTWGYVQFEGLHGSWLTAVAPYFCDLLTFTAVCCLLTAYTFKHRWIWVNVIMIGLLGPLVNSLYNYIKSFYGRGDVNGLATDLPSAVIHTYFLTTIVAYVVGTIFILRGARLRPTTENVQPAGAADTSGAAARNVGR